MATRDWILEMMLRSGGWQDGGWSTDCNAGDSASQSSGRSSGRSSTRGDGMRQEPFEVGRPGSDGAFIYRGLINRPDYRERS